MPVATDVDHVLTLLRAGQVGRGRRGVRRRPAARHQLAGAGRARRLRRGRAPRGAARRPAARRGAALRRAGAVRHRGGRALPGRARRPAHHPAKPLLKGRLAAAPADRPLPPVRPIAPAAELGTTPLAVDEAEAAGPAVPPMADQRPSRSLGSRRGARAGWGQPSSTATRTVSPSRPSSAPTSSRVGGRGVARTRTAASATGESRRAQPRDVHAEWRARRAAAGRPAPDRRSRGSEARRCRAPSVAPATSRLPGVRLGLGDARLGAVHASWTVGLATCTASPGAGPAGAAATTTQSTESDGAPCRRHDSE